MKDIILIIILQLIYVPMLALRTICMVKRLKLLTAFFGILESLIYVFGLSLVLTGEQTLVEMLVYALGFGIGLIVGIQIENRIAIGYTTMHVNIKEKNQGFINLLRESGYGVTVFQGEGREGARYQLDILTKRSQQSELMKLITLHEPDAFVTLYEPILFKGGYLAELMKKRLRG